jgi:hypothetical protein
MKRFLLTLAALALTATAADAGPIRDRLTARFSRPSGCSSCTTQTTTHQQLQGVQYGGAGLYPQPQPVPVVMPQVGTVQVVGHQQYQPIRLTSPLPVFPACVGGNCGR